MTNTKDIIQWRAVAAATIDVEREKYNKAKGVFSSHVSDRKKSMIAEHSAEEILLIRKSVMAALVDTSKPSVNVSIDTPTRAAASLATSHAHTVPTATATATATAAV